MMKSLGWLPAAMSRLRRHRCQERRCNLCDAGGDIEIAFQPVRVYLAPGSTLPEERRRTLDRVLEADALRYDAYGEGAVKARGKGGVEQDEYAGVAGAADEPSEGLLETQPGQHVVVARAAECRLARLVQDIRTRPRHTVEDDEPERAARHVDAVAHRIGAEQAGIFLGAKDVDQRRGIHAVDML